MVAVGSSAPGTELLFDEHAISANVDIQTREYHNETLILQPQPSVKDPNDPLRWPSWLKTSTYLNGLFFAFNGSMLGPLMSAGFLGLSKIYGRPLSDIAQFNGSILITQGLGNIVWGPCAVKFGRRPVYLLSNLGQTLTCVWCAVCVNKSYTNTLIARIFQGLFQAPVEALVPSTITDIFFTHERGTLISYYGFSVLIGNNIGPIISAALIQSTGGESWSFWFMFILCAVNWVLMFVAMPESKYTGERLNVQALINEQSEDAEGAVDISNFKEPKVAHVEDCNSETEESTQVPKNPYSRLLMPFSSIDKETSIFKLFCRPFLLVAYPTVLWSSAIYGIALSWHVILGVLISQIFGVQYGFNSIEQGLVYVALAIGQVVGVLLSGPLSDKVANYFSLRNDGIREPEMRLPTISFGAILTIIGSLIYGATIHHHTHWMGPIMGLAIQSAGCQNLANIAVTYSVDCHRELSTELMVTVACIKSAIAYIFTWVSNDWMAKSGALEMYGILSAVTAALCLTTIPLYIYGKRIRQYLHDKAWMSKLKLD